jgi:hypothetical protein
MISIVCPTCFWENAPNAVECEKCRMKLQRKGTTKLLSQSALPRYSDSPFIEVPKNTIILVAAGHKDQQIVIDARPKIFLGRQFPGENPPIDLTDFGAHDLGVSRQHAVLVSHGRTFMIEDLASSNGTWLNTLRLTPYIRYEVKSGDRLQLGRLPIFMYYDISE